jgi:hypothetical protein
MKSQNKGKGAQKPMTSADVKGVDSFLVTLHELNMNPYLLGLAYIVLNLGGRFMTLSVTPGQEAFLQNILFRPLLLFTIMFIGTRNIVVAFWLTLLILLCLNYLFNENSSWYLLQGPKIPDPTHSESTLPQ